MRWVTASFMLVAVSSFCFVLFIVFNYVLYNTDNGVFTILDNFANQFFNRYYLNWWDGINNSISFGFALAGGLCLFLAIICYIAEVFGSNKKVDAY